MPPEATTTASALASNSRSLPSSTPRQPLTRPSVVTSASTRWP